MVNLSNGLSLLRAPLALLFLQDNEKLRILAIFLAMLTDSIDGYVARKNHTVSKLGTILDPVMDKFFVYFALGVLFFENRLELWQVFAMLSRDFALCTYGLYLTLTKKWAFVEFKAFRFGKLATALQFIVLIALCLPVVISSYVYSLFIFFGTLALIELFRTPITVKKHPS